MEKVLKPLNAKDLGAALVASKGMKHALTNTTTLATTKAKAESALREWTIFLHGPYGSRLSSKWYSTSYPEYAKHIKHNRKYDVVKAKELLDKGLNPSKGVKVFVSRHLDPRFLTRLHTLSPPLHEVLELFLSHGAKTSDILDAIPRKVIQSKRANLYDSEYNNDALAIATIIDFVAKHKNNNDLERIDMLDVWGGINSVIFDPMDKRYWERKMEILLKRNSKRSQHSIWLGLMKHYSVYLREHFEDFYRDDLPYDDISSDDD